MTADPYTPYPKQAEFHALGAATPHRWIAHAAQAGATTAAAFEVEAHLNLDYPPWWVGRVFDAPIRALLVGPTREHVQIVMIPRIQLRPHHMNMGSIVGPVSFRDFTDKRRRNHNLEGCFDVIWVEEEPTPLEFDAIIACRSPAGRTILNFCPHKGLGPVSRRYLEKHDHGRFRMIQMPWTDARHLPSDWEKRMFVKNAWWETERTARLYGLPQEAG